METKVIIKEKAEAYDEVVNKLKGFMKQGIDPLITRANIQDFFPELKKSEDEKIREELMQYLWNLYHKDFCPPKPSIDTCDRWISWLEKQGGKNTAWSEEDEEIRNNCIYWLEKARKYFEKDEDLIYDKKWIVKCTDWLKNRVFPQLKQEWSEEDEKILSDIIKDLVHPWNEYIPDRIEDEIKWLKNRLKSIRPQSTWKPSEEMLEALDIAIRAGIQLGSWEEKALRELQKQLKAL